MKEATCLEGSNQVLENVTCILLVKSSFKNHFNSADDKKKKGKGGNGYKL